jgi:hypothetical protein
MKLVLEDGTLAEGIAFGEALPAAGEVVFNTGMTGYLEALTTGPFNMQVLAKRNDVKVIECNVRASRSFPFVLKATGANYVVEAMRRMLGVRRPVANRSLELEFVTVKAPMFSFSRLVGPDPMLGVEMSRTGEVGCCGDDQHEALLHALVATGVRQPTRGVLLSLGPFQEEYGFADEARVLADELGLQICATPGTAEALQGLGITAIRLEKRDGPDGPCVRSRRGRSTWSSIFLSNTMTSASPMVAGSVALPWAWACH